MEEKQEDQVRISSAWIGNAILIGVIVAIIAASLAYKAYLT